MVVTESGMTMFANELHRKKALLSMVVTESGMAMVSNELHLEKAQSPMVVTESGIVTVSLRSCLLPILPTNLLLLAPTGVA